MGANNQDKEELMSEQSQDPPVFRFFTEIGIIEQLARTRLERVLPEGIKISQFAVLNHLVRLPGKWNPARLASAFQVTRAAMTNTLQRLESRGLIKIETDPGDGRGKLVSLCVAGRDMREKCIVSIGPFMVELEKELGGQEFANALPMLEAVRTYLDGQR